MTVDWNVSDVPPSTYREGIASTYSAESTNNTDSTDRSDSAGISLSEKGARLFKLKYLRSLRHGQVWKAKARR